MPRTDEERRKAAVCQDAAALLMDARSSGGWGHLEEVKRISGWEGSDEIAMLACALAMALRSIEQRLP